MSNPAKLPLGIQDFTDLIRSGYVYIDKTRFLYELITTGKPYFLSRPRRFGKSLTVSTFEALFLAKRELFKDLWIDNSDWGWQPYPVIRLDMANFPNQSTALFSAALKDRLIHIGAQHQVVLDATLEPQTLLLNLIESLGATRQVVVLVDEYDKPIVDRLEDIEVANSNRDLLRQFYGVLKSQDGNIKFIFLTGVTKFAKVSVFSGLNNLNDITLQSAYSSIMGYTKEELVQYFDQEVKALALVSNMPDDVCYAQIKDWYNGYRFSDDGDLVYNPFSVLKLLKEKSFRPHWFETGTPTFLLQLLKKREFDPQNLESIEVSEADFATFEIDNIPTIPLLYQTGYLTITDFNPRFRTYRLGYPNHEVREAFTESLIRYFTEEKALTGSKLSQVYYNLDAAVWDCEAFITLIKEIIALIPYDLYIKRESYYHSLFYLITTLAGLKIGAEVHTQLGRADAVLITDKRVIIFELKLNESAQFALEQIKDKKYYEMFHDKKMPIYLVGINFDANTRTIDDFILEEV